MTQTAPYTKDISLANGDFNQFVVGCKGAVRQIWCESSEAFPDLGAPVPLSKQRENEVAAESLIDHIFESLCRYPEEEDGRVQWRRKLLARIDAFIGDHMAWPKAQRELALSPDFFRVTGGFSRSARAFASDIIIDDLYQALRNVWIMMSFQRLFDRPVDLTDSVFGYSMLYPFTDNRLDSQHLSRAEKTVQNLRLERRLAGEPLVPRDDHEADVFRLVARIESQYPRDAFANVYRSLLTINRAQAKSLQQQGLAGSRGPLDVLGISIEKGGSSVLTDGFLVCGEMDREWAGFTFGYGVFLQLMDDLQDTQRDLAAKHMTLFSQQAASTSLGPLVNRLFHYLDQSLAPAFTFLSPAAETVSVLMRTNCRIMIMQAVAAHRQFFTNDFTSRLQRYSPFRFGPLNSLRSRQQRQYQKAKRALAARGLENAVFEFMG